MIVCECLRRTPYSGFLISYVMNCLIPVLMMTFIDFYLHHVFVMSFVISGKIANVCIYLLLPGNGYLGIF